MFGVGTPSGAATVNIRMPGQYADAESGLFYNWNRYYNPAIGRYISSDPIGIEGGLNTFLYAEANPVMYVDPEGLQGIGHNGGPPLENSSLSNMLRLRLLSSTALGLGIIFDSTPTNVGEYEALQRLKTPNPNIPMARASQGEVCRVENYSGNDHSDLQSQLEALGGGKPISVPTAKGARQFIFPNGTVLRFDIEPGQYLPPRQGPHINLEHQGSNIHIDLKKGN